MAELTQQVEGHRAVLPARLPSLTGMRFIAAAMVFFHHTTFANLFASASARDHYIPIVRQGNSGVSFFFILSGFVLTWSMRSNDNPPRFWRRRFFKIYPNHIVVFIVSVLLITYGVTTFGVGTDITVTQAILNLLMLQAWPHDLGIMFSINLVTWSLSCEIFFYLLFPLLVALIQRIRPQRLWAWAGATTAAVIAVPFIAMALPDEPPIPGVGTTTWETWFIQSFPPVRLLEFVLGILLARIVLSGRRMPVGVGGATALTVAAYALTPLFPETFRLAAVMVVPLGLLIGASAEADAANQRSWLASRTMVWLGNISFAFYLWHYMVLMTVRSMVTSDTGFPTGEAFGLIALAFGITVVLAWLLYSTVERPMMRRFATSRRRTTHSVGPAATAPSTAGPRPAAAEPH